ncbi:MAG TPA: response regulator [Gemmatimonadota bacterium]|nr:response regulator [Gemmatimonadota bacterium]
MAERGADRRVAEARILLVEDNPDDIELTLRAFRKVNLSNEVEVARDGEEALRVLLGAEGGDDVDLPTVVLLDLNLPKIGGLEVLRRLRGDPRTRFLPVVILTSSAEERDLVQGYELGANSYVRKPVAFDAFVDAARQLGLYWLLLNRQPRTGR